MGTEAEEVYQAGLELDQEERALVARRLLASVQEDSSAAVSDSDKAWGEEISSRLEEVISGKVELTTFSQTRAKARALLDDLRR